MSSIVFSLMQNSNCSFSKYSWLLTQPALHIVSNSNLVATTLLTAQWLLFTTNRAQYGVDQLTFGQQIFFRGDKIYFQRRFFQCKMGGRTVIKQMVIVSDEKF